MYLKKLNILYKRQQTFLWRYSNDEQTMSRVSARTFVYNFIWGLPNLRKTLKM
jgi:hypothetical protein